MLADRSRSRQIPTVIVQGRYDVVCPSAFPRQQPFADRADLSSPNSDHRLGAAQGVPRGRVCA